MNGTAQAFQVRGYALAHSASYLRQVAGEAEAKRLIEGFPVESQRAIRDAQGAEWHPVRVLSDLTNSLVSLAGSDDARAQDILIRCGLHLGQEASNTFLKLVMKMLTVNLFAKKVPDFWKRDFTGGRLALGELKERSVTIQTFEMAGYDHAVCTVAGFISFTLQSMGKSIDSVKIQGWSIKNPSADGASFEITWK